MLPSFIRKPLHVLGSLAEGIAEIALASSGGAFADEARTIDWKEALKYAGLVKIAESVKPDDPYGQTQLEAIKSAGYSYLQPLYGYDLATDVDAHLGKTVTFGFLAASPDGELVAAIRGTDTILEWIHDAEFLMVPCPVKGASSGTDDGFTAVYKSLLGCSFYGLTATTIPAKEAIASYTHSESIEVKRVTICGHSLGGALATLLALDVALNTPFKNPTCFTFASPRVGDHAFARAYNAAVPNTFRVANRMDLVSMLPSAVFPFYEHVAQHFEIHSKAPLYGSVPCLHHLSSYLWILANLAGVSGYKLDADCVAKGASL